MFWAFLSGLMVLAGAHLSSDFSPDLPLLADDDDDDRLEFT
jgi:hypothetical protein